MTVMESIRAEMRRRDVLIEEVKNIECSLAEIGAILKDANVTAERVARPYRRAMEGSHRALVLSLVSDGRIWRASDIQARIKPANPASLASRLAYMTNAGELERVSFGHYRAAMAQEPVATTA